MHYFLPFEWRLLKSTVTWCLGNDWAVFKRKVYARCFWRFTSSGTDGLKRRHSWLGASVWSCWAQVEMIRWYFHHRRQRDRKTDGYLALHPSFPPCSGGCSCLSDIPGPERGGRRLADTKTPPGSDTVIGLMRYRVKSIHADQLSTLCNSF